MNSVRLIARLKELRERAVELRAIPSEDFTDEQLTELESNNEQRELVIRKIDAIQTGTTLDEDEDRTSNGEIPGQGGSFDSGMENRGGPCADRSYRNMFYGGDADSSHLSRDQFSNQSDFLEVLNSGRFDDRLIRSSMGEGVGEDGGFSVPEEFAAQWLDDSLEDEIVRPLAQVWAMQAPTRKVPAWDGNDRSGGTTHGGFEMAWLAEKATGTRQTAKMRMLTLKAKKAGIYAQISNELAADGLGFENQLTNALVKSIGFGLDGVFFFGSGSGQPQGALSDGNPALVTVAKETGQAASTIVYENLTKMFARMAPACLKNAVWIANATAIPQLMTLNMAIGTGGSFFPALKESESKFYLFGKRVLFTEQMKSLGSVGDIAMVDFTQYAIGLRKEVSIDKSNAPGWTEDMSDYRVLIRVDAQGTWNKVITPKNGDSLSWAVTLAERS